MAVSASHSIISSRFASGDLKFCFFPNANRSFQSQQLYQNLRIVARFLMTVKKKRLIYLLFCRAGSAMLLRLSLVRRVEAPLQLRCLGFSLWWLLLLRSTVSRVLGLQELQHMDSAVAAPGTQRTGSVGVARRLSCSRACGIFRKWGSNPVPCIGRWTPNHQTTREAL